MGWIGHDQLTWEPANFLKNAPLLFQMHRASFWQLAELLTQAGGAKYYHQPEAGNAAAGNAAAGGPAPVGRPPKPIYQQVAVGLFVLDGSGGTRMSRSSWMARIFYYEISQCSIKRLISPARRTMALISRRSVIGMAGLYGCIWGIQLVCMTLPHLNRLIYAATRVPTSIRRNTYLRIRPMPWNDISLRHIKSRLQDK